jgi:hypothetical protein
MGLKRPPRRQPLPAKDKPVFTRQDESLINKSIKSLTEELDPEQFWRIHQSIIVNVSQIDEVRRTKTGRGSVRLRDRLEVLTVRHSYLHLFKKMRGFEFFLFTPQLFHSVLFYLKSASDRTSLRSNNSQWSSTERRKT